MCNLSETYSMVRADRLEFTAVGATLAICTGRLEFMGREPCHMFHTGIKIKSLLTASGSNHNSTLTFPVQKLIDLALNLIPLKLLYNSLCISKF